MSCNFWCHETKQLNQTIETYNNGNKRSMIRQRRKDRRRRDQNQKNLRFEFSSHLNQRLKRIASSRNTELVPLTFCSIVNRACLLFSMMINNGNGKLRLVKQSPKQKLFFTATNIASICAFLWGLAWKRLIVVFMDFKACT